MNVSPGYGRQYKSKKAALADWLAGKDFIVEDFNSRWCGKPVNAEQVFNEPQINVYQSNGKLFVFTKHATKGWV